MIAEWSGAGQQDFQNGPDPGGKRKQGKEPAGKRNGRGQQQGPQAQPERGQRFGLQSRQRVQEVLPQRQSRRSQTQTRQRQPGHQDQHPQQRNRMDIKQHGSEKQDKKRGRQPPECRHGPTTLQSRRRPLAQPDEGPGPPQQRGKQRQQREAADQQQDKRRAAEKKTTGIGVVYERLLRAEDRRAWA